MRNLKRIAIKELFSFFSSLTAFVFFGTFLATVLFIFFWVETFFSRNIADVRPMFEWMPLLMIFLVPALTMRMWADERKSETLEFLLTSPVSNLELVLGKFTACMGLIVIALALTLPIPVTVSLLAGDLDWGPVIGGYVAAIFLASAYTAIGLNISSRTANQIVSLLLSVLVCGLFWIIGSDGLTSLFSSNLSEALKLLGSGARFQSITRGVIDLRDLYYYASITGVFLSWNILSLETLRWAGNSSRPLHRRWIVITSLCMANFIAGNFWIQQITWARIDLTQGRIYSISPATRRYLAELQEPLLIRGYFSKKSHPLLQPLVPRLCDLLKEYAIAGKGKVRVEIVDPLDKPEIEKEAGEKYGIKPAVFQTASKYQAALTNSYFNVLLKYGDQFRQLSWSDLIEVKMRGDQGTQVDLRNPEYDITSSIKKLLYGYQSAGNPFSDVEQPVKFIAYVSPDDRLPEPLINLKRMLLEESAALQKQSNGRFSAELVDPDANGGNLAKKIVAEYGFRPMALGPADAKTFWFYLTMASGRQVIQVPLPDEVRKDAVKESLEAAVKRFSKGFVKTIGISTPKSIVLGGENWSRGRYNMLREYLNDSYAIEDVSLDSGAVPSNVDLLFLIAPDRLQAKQLFAVDQFLMKGGCVMLAASPFDLTIGPELACHRVESGLEPWLQSFGVDVQETMVLDSQCFPLPIPTRREVEGYTVEETRLAPYPYFVDVRGDGLVPGNHIASGLDQVNMTWASPLNVDRERNRLRTVTELLRSSPGAWTAGGAIIEPHFSPRQPLGFPVGKQSGSKLLAVAIEGKFPSYFADRKLPLFDESAKGDRGIATGTDPGSQAGKRSPYTNVISTSPDSARIILFASNSFLSDGCLALASQGIGSVYEKPLELVLNAADWALQDRELLAIRGRGHFARTLRPMTPGFEMFFEYLNYGLAFAGLIAVWLLRRQCWLSNQKRLDMILQSIPMQPAIKEVRP